MTPSHHAIISLVVAVPVYAFTRSWSTSVGVFLGGTVIDIDHWFDYLREGDNKFDYRAFVAYCHQQGFRRLILVFHSYELLALGALASYHWNFPPVVVGTLAGMGLHLILDQVANRAVVHPAVYFLLYRAGKKFSGDALFPRRSGKVRREE